MKSNDALLMLQHSLNFGASFVNCFKAGVSQIRESAADIETVFVYAALLFVRTLTLFQEAARIILFFEIADAELRCYTFRKVITRVYELFFIEFAHNHGKAAAFSALSAGEFLILEFTGGKNVAEFGSEHNGYNSYTCKGNCD